MFCSCFFVCWKYCKVPLHLQLLVKWEVQWRTNQDPPYSREEVPAHGKIAFICLVSKFVWIYLLKMIRMVKTLTFPTFFGGEPPKTKTIGFHNPSLLINHIQISDLCCVVNEARLFVYPVLSNP